MFDHILLPLDGSLLAECVLPHFLPFAQTSCSQVTLLTVLDQFENPYLSTSFDVMNYAIYKAEAQAYLHEVSDRLSSTGVQVVTALAEGKAADCIIQYAHDHRVSLIVLSSHGLSGLSGWNISSVVQKVLLRANTSLLIIPAYRPVEMELEDFRYQKVFVALDGSLRAEWVLPIASQIAVLHHASLLLAIIVAKPELPTHLPLWSEEVEKVNWVVDRNRRWANEYLKQICSRLPADLDNIQTYVMVGENPVDALHELVEQTSTDLVILSAHGCSGSYKRLYGSVTLSFIAYGTTPLLILQDVPVDRIVCNWVEVAISEHPGH